MDIKIEFLQEIQGADKLSKQLCPLSHRSSYICANASAAALRPSPSLDCDDGLGSHADAPSIGPCNGPASYLYRQIYANQHTFITWNRRHYPGRKQKTEEKIARQSSLRIRIRCYGKVLVRGSTTRGDGGHCYKIMWLRGSSILS